MSRIEQLPKMWQRAGMYLFDYARSDGASMFAEFIHATYYMSGMNRPKRVRFQSQGEYQLMIAEGYGVQLDEIGMANGAHREQSSLIDWLSEQAVYTAPSPRLQSCIGVANIISFTEFCVLDMSVADEHFRQLFYLGKPASPCQARKCDLPTGAPYLSLWYTLHPKVFHCRTVKAKAVKEALNRLRKHIPVELKLTVKKRFDGFEMAVQTMNVEQSLSEKAKPNAATPSGSPDKVLVAHDALPQAVAQLVPQMA